MRNFLLAFIPLFIAVDALGVLPIFASLTEGISGKKRHKVIFESMVTAICLGVGFIFVGNALFKFLNITIGDFMVAGGTVLFCIAISDIISPSKRRQIPTEELGAVPLGTPLIVGPAVLTTSMILLGEYGLAPTLVSLLGNVILAGLIFSISKVLMKQLGVGGSRAISKITSLLLAAIAVMMVRRGIITYIIKL